MVLFVDCCLLLVLVSFVFLGVVVHCSLFLVVAVVCFVCVLCVVVLCCVCCV